MFSRAPSDSVQSPHRANPQDAFPIFIDGRDERADQTATLICEVLERLQLCRKIIWIRLLQAYPDISLFVLIDGNGVVRSQALAVFRMVAVTVDLSEISIDLKDSSLH